MKSVDSSELTVPQIDILKEASYQTKERAASVVLSIPFSRVLSHSGMGAPSNTSTKSLSFSKKCHIFRNAARPRQNKSAASTDPRSSDIFGGRLRASQLSHLESEERKRSR